MLWLPREEQLRELLGAAFRRLEAVPGGFVVVLAGPGGHAPEDGPPEDRHVDPDAECAYARALLALHTR